GPPIVEEQRECTTPPVPLSPSFEHAPRILLPRSVAPAAELVERKGAVMDHDQQPRAPRLDDLLALCRQMAALEPDQITAAMLEEMASLTLHHAVGMVNTMRVPLVVLD